MPCMRFMDGKRLVPGMLGYDKGPLNNLCGGTGAGCFYYRQFPRIPRTFPCAWWRYFSARRIGPSQLRIDSLIQRVKEGNVKEVILATNPTVEGDTTALYIQRMLADSAGDSCTVTRLASGLPVGGDLEYADRLTLARSFRGRVRV